jgi:hypothetical protein
MTTTDRNNAVTSILEKYFSTGEQEDAPSSTPAITDDLDIIFNTTVWGYREILLVIAVARLIDPSYKAYSGFYACNPRALYEGPIREQLLTRSIPHRKSGPLNVAKAAIGINEQWMAQRRPAVVAQSVVRIVKLLDSYNEAELGAFLTLLLSRLLSEASRVANLVVETSPQSDPGFLRDISSELISSVPDGGNTPQRTVGLLMQAYHEDLQSGIVVGGFKDSASTTNTTSKKPGDVTEELIDGTLIKVYEITVKPFTLNRMAESYESVKDYATTNDSPIVEVMVICREQDVPSDTSSGDSISYYGKLEHQDVTYHFIDIFQWISSQLLRMSSDARLAYFESLGNYIAEVNTAEAVKLKWNSLNQQ